MLDQYTLAMGVQRVLGEIQVDPPLVAGSRAVVDGVNTAMPTRTPSGLHLVQIGPKNGTMQFARIVSVRAGEKLVVRTGLKAEPPPVVVIAPAPAPAPVPPPPTAVAVTAVPPGPSEGHPVEAVQPAPGAPGSGPALPPAQAKRHVGWLIAGAAAEVGAGWAAALAMNEVAIQSDAANEGDLAAARDRQRIFGMASYGFAAVGAVGIVLHFAL
jgi:hypothetical protein